MDKMKRCVADKTVSVVLDDHYIKCRRLALVFSPNRLIVVGARHRAHVRQTKFCLRVCQVIFSGFSPHILISTSHMICNNLERDVKLNLKKLNK